MHMKIRRKEVLSICDLPRHKEAECDWGCVGHHRHLNIILSLVKEEFRRWNLLLMIIFYNELSGEFSQFFNPLHRHAL